MSAFFEIMNMNQLLKRCYISGAQWGDEGKGKLVDLLAENADVVARCQVKNGLAFAFYAF